MVLSVFINGMVVLLILVATGAVLLYSRMLKTLKQTRRAEKKLHDENEVLTNELERLKNELYLLSQKAGESDRLKSAFLCNMSHELRTPLHAIMGFAGLISNHSIADNEKITYANIINQNVDSLLEIINDIFDISQIEAGVSMAEHEPVFVNNLINTIQTHLNLKKPFVNKENITILTHKANKDNSFAILSDNYKLKRALSHLADNALKYTNNGFIEIGYVFGDKGAIEFYVKDDGIGFSEDKLQYIFNQFRQIDESPTREFGGLGLGLAIAQKFAAMLNGKINVKSIEGKGSTFSISLPYPT